MKKELNKKSNQVTVLLQGSYTVDSDVLKKFIREEHCPLFYSLDDSGIIRFEWFLDEDEKTGTLIEISLINFANVLNDLVPLISEAILIVFSAKKASYAIAIPTSNNNIAKIVLNCELSNLSPTFWPI